MIRLIAAAVWTAILALGILCQSKESSGKSNPQLCNVYQYPERYLNKELKFAGEYTFNLTMQSVIRAPDCGNNFIVASVVGSDQNERDRIARTINKIQDDGEPIDICFAGVLRENANPNGYEPIKWLLQGYSIEILELIKVGPRSKGCPGYN